MTRALTLIVTALAIAAAAPPAQAWIGMNGTADNGTSRNGVEASGASLLAIELPPQPE